MVDDAHDDRGHLRHSNHIAVRAVAQCGELAVRDCLSNYPCRLQLSLVRTYRSGDLGQTYPVSRGSSPVLVASGAAVFAHETLDVVSCIGIALVSGGILRFPFKARRFEPTFFPLGSPQGF